MTDKDKEILDTLAYAGVIAFNDAYTEFCNYVDCVSVENTPTACEHYDKIISTLAKAIKSTKAIRTVFLPEVTEETEHE